MALWIASNGDMNEIHQRQKFSLEQLQRAVDGDIEIIRLAPRLVMVINEEGKLRRLPLNRQATSIFREATRSQDTIVGDVLIARPDEID